MTVQIAGRMSRKRTVKRLSGELVDMLDESNGGWIVKDGVIVNPQRFNELVAQEEDRRKAAQAVANQAEVSQETIDKRNAGRPM